MKTSTKRVIRTSLEVLVGLAVLAPILVAEAGLSPSELPWIGTVLIVAAAVTRVFANPQVEGFLARWGLSLESEQPDGRHELGRKEDRSTQ